MIIRDKIVLGLGFGDEGKGLVTDYLCLHHPDSLVIRFSGGQNCGHTVVDGEFNHVFSNFGSGSYRNIPTYWSKYCTVDPVGIINELKILKDKGVKPVLFIESECPITTPFDKEFNIWNNKATKHGSCGVGIYATKQREKDNYSLHFIDLFYPKIFEQKLEAIKQYRKFTTVDNSSLMYFIKCCEKLIKLRNIHKVNLFLRNYYDGNKRYEFKVKIFEGSQGLLLDQNNGFFPNVTPSNTGPDNVFELYNYEINNFRAIKSTLRWPEIYLVTRAYQTRHGNGYMSNESDSNIDIEIADTETNLYNRYQGKFRKGYLDLDLLRYGIEKNRWLREYGSKILVITCLDHVKDYKYIYESKLRQCKTCDIFINKISEILGIKKVYISKSNNSKRLQLKVT